MVTFSTFFIFLSEIGRNIGTLSVRLVVRICVFTVQIVVDTTRAWLLAVTLFFPFLTIGAHNNYSTPLVE